MGIFSTINYNNNKTFIPTTTISFVLTLIAGVLFFVSTISQQTFAQDTFLTINEALEQTFGKENGELENETRDKGKTGFTIEDLNPEEDLAKEFANASTTGLSEVAINALKSYREQSPEYKAKQALTYKYNELQEKFYLECIINKESGEFKNTIDCMTWSHDNAQIQLGLK